MVARFAYRRWARYDSVDANFAGWRLFAPIAANQTMHWSTASDVFPMDNQPAVPSDGQRSSMIPVHESPYAPTTTESVLMTETTRRRPLAALASFSVGATCGYAIWAASVTLTGRDEPWDVRGFYYPTALAVSGALSAAIFYRCWYLGPLGVFAGQALFVYFGIMPDDVWPLYKHSLLALATIGLIPAVIGALPVFGLGVLLARVRRLLARVRRRTSGCT